MKARTLMVQGTSSSVGKSLLVAALCRIFREDGIQVVPFKSQNMALNAAVTPEGLEIGRAQAVQAEAAGVAPHVDMNPILLKPEGNSRAQVVVLGRPSATLGAVDYHERKKELRAVAKAALDRLRARAELVVIEGAGSPVEINLRDRELVNMWVAEQADAPVVLVGDIDRGGIFASLLGTLDLLRPEERARVAGLIVNKFRGDPALFVSGVGMLEERARVPVLGVVPYLREVGLADEDSVALEARRGRGRAARDELEISIVAWPLVSNFDDFEPLEREPGVVVRWVEDPAELIGTDLVVLPGSKRTSADLAWLHDRGFDVPLRDRARRGEPILGICGGCQALGVRLLDPERLEAGAPETPGLGLLPVVTTFEADKRTTLVEVSGSGHWLLPEAVGARGYEIHHGRVERIDGALPATMVRRHGGPPAPDGAVGSGGAVIGTMVHGLFDEPQVRAGLLSSLRARRGLPAPSSTNVVRSRDEAFRALAATVRASLDMDRLRRIVGLG